MTAFEPALISDRTAVPVIAVQDMPDYRGIDSKSVSIGEIVCGLGPTQRMIAGFEHHLFATKTTLQEMLLGAIASASARTASLSKGRALFTPGAAIWASAISGSTYPERNAL